MKLFLTALAALVLLGCSDGGRGLYETAQFEEQQRNIKHARSLYEEIVRKYPESDFGAKAKARLEELKD